MPGRFLGCSFPASAKKTSKRIAQPLSGQLVFGYMRALFHQYLVNFSRVSSLAFCLFVTKWTEGGVKVMIRGVSEGKKYRTNPKA